MLAGSSLGALLLLGSILFLSPPVPGPDADAPLAIDDSSGDSSVFKSSPDSQVALLAPPIPRPPSLGRGRLAPRPGEVPGGALETATDLPTRAPPR